MLPEWVGYVEVDSQPHQHQLQFNAFKPKPRLSLLNFPLIAERISEYAIAQSVGDYLRFNVLVREDAKDQPFTDVNVKMALSPQLF
jgi:hypothetical protein